MLHITAYRFECLKIFNFCIIFNIPCQLVTLKIFYSEKWSHFKYYFFLLPMRSLICISQICYHNPNWSHSKCFRINFVKLTTLTWRCQWRCTGSNKVFKITGTTYINFQTLMLFEWNHRTKCELEYPKRFIDNKINIWYLLLHLI